MNHIFSDLEGQKSFLVFGQRLVISAIVRRGTWIVKGNKKWQKHSTVHKQKSVDGKATRMEFLEKGCLMIDRLTFKYVTFIFSLGCAQLQAASNL